LRAIIPILVDAFRFTPGGAKRTFRLWMETETHVFAFAMAANVLIAFFPFLLVIASLCKYVLHWPDAVQAIERAVRDFFYGEAGNFLATSIDRAFLLSGHTRFEWRSLLLLMITANGVFVPLEVALNRAWGVARNRSIWMNQVVSTGLIFVCGALALLASIISAAHTGLFNLLFGRWPGLVDVLTTGVLKLVSLPFSILTMFLVYWLLPFRKINPRYILPSAIRVGLALEIAKWLSIWITPWMLAKFYRETTIFQHSLTILAWSYLASMIVLAGAQSSAWLARTMEARELEAAKEIAIPTTVVSQPSPNG